MKKIKNNSLKCHKNDIFIATHDDLLDRHLFINRLKKVSLVISDKKIETDLPSLEVLNTNDSYAQICNDYYKRPFDEVTLIGVTGTDGKTTTCSIIKDLLNCFDKCAYLGTNGFIYDKKYNTINTTPALEEILRYGKILKNNSYKYLVMEASSEGLLHNRCHNLPFKIAIMTNVTTDHLNTHKNIENYLKAKLKLFKYNKGIAILNIDDEHYNFFKTNINNYVTYGENSLANYYFYDIKLFINKTTFKLKVKDKTYQIESPLLGKFNIYNLVAAIATVNKLGYPIKDIISNINKLSQVAGRMNFISYGQNYSIILDYAHTEKAVGEVLNFLKEVTNKRIITVSGCAGGRYKEKRSKIGKIISDLSDIAIFTEDDPRYEKIEDILNDMKKDIKKSNVILIKSRKKAIKKALDIARKDDLVVILGKGLDNYMAIGKKYKKYNDLKVIKRYFTKVF